MKWLVDSDILIEGERGNPAFAKWIAASISEQVATADVIRAEFLIGVHAVTDAQKRLRAEKFYRERIAPIVSLANEKEDYELAAKIAGEARRGGKGKPSLADALLGAIALRTGATVASQNLKDFRAMGIPCENPLEEVAD